MTGRTLHLIQSQQSEAEKQGDQKGTGLAGRISGQGVGLLAEHFEHGFALGAINLRERFLYERTIVHAAVVQHFIQAESCVT